MAGLPARGKTSLARKLAGNLALHSLSVAQFNNGEVRRRMLAGDTSRADFFSPGNLEGIRLREEIADQNLAAGRAFLNQGGDVAIIDATNVTRARRLKICQAFAGTTVLFIGCVNEDREILTTSIAHKTRLSEFGHLTYEEAARSFEERIAFYQARQEPLEEDPAAENHLVLDSLHGRVLGERLTDVVPYYALVRDVLVSETISNLYLVRHGETCYNLEQRIGGDSELTARGLEQARNLAAHFGAERIPFVFTSTKQRTVQTARALLETQPRCRHVALAEFDEIDAGICEEMTYDEIRREMPGVHSARTRDKYNYVYPRGEGYATLAGRIERGVKKALYLAGDAAHIVIIGHQAVNRMILSHFLYRRTEDVPYIYIPQDKYFHITATQTKKLFEMRPY